MSSQMQNKKRILVIDDNVDAATTLADLLDMLGGEARCAHDGAGGVRETQAWQPDVVLLDIGLPDISGYEVARRIRGLADVTQPRLIALTGWGQDEDRRLAAEAGFDEHWTKPIQTDRLDALLG